VYLKFKCDMLAEEGGKDKKNFIERGRQFA
jgi:hypothetical protein